MNEVELKARAYELVMIIENARAELIKINEELVKIANQPKPKEDK